MNKELVTLAVDVGAESGRVMAMHFDGESLRVDELHRFANGPVDVRGTLFWDVIGLWREIQIGIDKGAVLHPASMGVDTWGVDFALLDSQGKLLGNPVHYRHPCTDGVMERVFEHVSKAEIFNITGIQFSQINTIYQLMSLVENDSPQLKAACTFLIIPDLFNYFLTGVKANEFSISSTTQMLSASTGNWAIEILEKLGIPTHIFSEVVPHLVFSFGQMDSEDLYVQNIKTQLFMKDLPSGTTKISLEAALQDNLHHASVSALAFKPL